MKRYACGKSEFDRLMRPIRASHSRLRTIRTTYRC